MASNSEPRRLLGEAEGNGALLVFGSGPGIGRNVGALFAARGFRRIVLLSRNAERLEEDAAFVRAAAAASVAVETVALDLAASPLTVRAALEFQLEAALQGSRLDAVLYNAARLGPSKILDFSAEELEADLRVSVVNLYAIASWALPRMAAEGANPAFLVTSGLLHKFPFPNMFSLATCKAGQFNLVHSLHKEFEQRGVHVALIVVGGTVADESRVTNAKNIANEAWKLFAQPSGKGKLEVEMLDPEYEQHVKRREQER